MADIYVKGPHNTVIKYADQGNGTHAEVVSAAVTAADISDGGSHVVPFLTADGIVQARTALGAQTQDAFLDDILAANGVATTGQFLKFDGANLVFAAVPGGGDLLAANNLADVASASTALANLGGAAATGGTITTKTLAGITTISGTQLLTASAMAADEIDVAKARNTKTVPASNPTYTFSAVPSDGQTWALELTGDTAARTVTIPSTFDMSSQSTRTTFLMPASGKATIYWQRQGAVNLAWGIPSALDNYSATAAPTATDDAADGYAVGSFWVDTTNDNAYICVDATATAAVWDQIDGSGGGYSQVDYTSASPHTNTLTETTVWTKTIPANTLLANKRMTVQMRLTRGGTAASYTAALKFGGQTVDTVSVGTASRILEFVAVGKTNSTQVGYQADDGNSDPYGTAVPASLTVDGTASQDITVTLTLTDTGTSVTPQEIDIRVD